MSYVIKAPIRVINSRRKVFADVSQHDFDSFRDRCIAEGIIMGDALAELVHQYAHGAILVPGTLKNHHGTGVDYLKEREGDNEEK